MGFTSFEAHIVGAACSGAGEGGCSTWNIVMRTRVGARARQRRPHPAGAGGPGGWRLRGQPRLRCSGRGRAVELAARAALLTTPARRPPRGTTTAVDHRSGGWAETQPGRELGRDGFAWGRAAVRGRGRTDWTESPKASALEVPCVLRRRRDRAAWASGPGPWERPGTARGAALPDGGSAQGPPRGAAIVVVAQARDVGAKRRFRRHRRET
jgi:hypothetical protein